MGRRYTANYNITANLIGDDDDSYGVTRVTENRTLEADSREEAEQIAKSYIPEIESKFPPRSNPTTLLDKID